MELLSMADAISQLVAEASWKLRTLLRTRRFYNTADLVSLYKAHLLSYLEYRTPAIYHATRDLLVRLDAVQSKFLSKAGLDEVEALDHFRLAPLPVRRDMAMLGVIHRTALGQGPAHFKEVFPSASGATTDRIEDPRRFLRHPVVKRSALGLVSVYNLLPDRIVAHRSVPAFQKSLQQLVLERAKQGRDDWQQTLSPRVAMSRHPLTS